MDREVQQGNGEVRKLAEWQLALPLALAFASIFLAPLLMLVGVSFFNDDKITQPGFGQWAKFLGDPFSYKVIADTMLLGLKTVCATIVIGYPLALIYLDASPRLQKVLIFIIVMPLLLSVVVRTFAWIVVLGREGVVNTLLLQLGIISEPLRLLADRARPRDLADPDRDAADAAAPDQRDVAPRSRTCATPPPRWAPRAGAPCSR
jgi:ABC-type spermidine/putrescine transport system permease subunit I